jgi:hypothetical protein
MRKICVGKRRRGEKNTKGREVIKCGRKKKTGMNN